MCKKLIAFSVTLLLSFLINSSINARAALEKDLYEQQNRNFSSIAAYGIVAHRVGKIHLSVSNNGTLGLGFSQSGASDYFTGDGVSGCEYPINSNIQYLFAAAFWIGAVVNRDTLVSVAADGWTFIREFAPYEAAFGGEIKKRSILFPDNADLYEGAVSEEDYIMVYADSGNNNAGNDYFGRPHIPLNVEITQRSFSWSYPYADDFVLFDYSIKNMNVEKLEQVYMGIYCDADVGGPGNTTNYTDDICGFIETVPTMLNTCEFLDTVNIAWVADNDGDPLSGRFTGASPTSITGIRVIRTPGDSLDVSFNWWISNGSPLLDFGPREKSGVGKLKEEFRDFRTGGLGTPEGDVNKYYQMRNREFDYDQPLSATIQPTDSLWIMPDPDNSRNYSDGFDTRFLLSWGPFDINPGEVLPVSFAYIAGENFHVDPTNGDNNLIDAYNPDAFYENLNFLPFGENSSWASRVYDNPGIDTDGDNYYGKFRFCCNDSTDSGLRDTIWNEDSTAVDSIMIVYDYDQCDTLYYEGDNVPDFRGAAPPPAPEFWVTPGIGKVHVRFNGLLSETTKDIFSRTVDFEGYRVYISRDIRASSYTMLASYDRENYNKYVYNERRYPDAGYELTEFPFTTDSLRCLYGDSCNDTTFDPSTFTRNSPYTHPMFPESTFYFAPQDFNASDLGGENTSYLNDDSPIRKIYPNQPYPTSLIPDSANADELTEDGYLKYFEYEFTVTDLLPTVPYYVNVTSFDFGSPQSGLAALESSVTARSQLCYTLNSAQDAVAQDLDVYVWPNPYRFDGNYRQLGYEGRAEDDEPNDRIRALHFGNLPPVCTIRIYSIDGDLIREFDHNKAVDDPTSSHDEWDLITRNTQLIVSGIYYWVVEAEDGKTQIGKFAIIM